MVLSKFLKYSFGYKVQGGILQLTLGIALIISILCSSVILLSLYANLSFLRFKLNDQLNRNANSGIQYLLASRTSLPYNEVRSIDLFGEETDSVEIVRRPWGIFEIISATAFQGKNRASRVAIVAPKPNEIGKATLYMPDDNAPLYLVGKTKIKGTVFVSARKFSTGVIDGKGFLGSRLVDGDVKLSEATMPPLDTTMVSALKSIAADGVEGSPYAISILSNFPDTNHSPFANPSASYYYSDAAIELQDSVQGNKIIHSGTSIHVGASAFLSDVILRAPEINFEEGFRGSVQCFADRMIEVESDCQFAYPSALVLVGGERDSTIVVGRDSKIFGLILIPGSDQSVGSRGKFRMEPGSVLNGMAYINGSADIEGTIRGHITARRFQATVGSVPYGNHLYNTVLDGPDRSPFMPGSFVWGSSSTVTIAKWVY